MYVLVAGGGKVGANLARLLLRAGEEMRGLVDAAALQRDGAAHVECPHL